MRQGFASSSSLLLTGLAWWLGPTVRRLACSSYSLLLYMLCRRIY